MKPTLRAVERQLRTVRLWCAYDYATRQIITTSPYRYIASQDVRRIKNTILLELKGTYAADFDA